MKKSHAVGLAAGLSGSLFVASFAPTPAHTQSAVNNCPAIDYAAEGYFANTPATETLSKLGGFTLGVIAAKCRDGETAVTNANGETTLSWRSVSGGDFTKSNAPTASNYTLSVTARANAAGALDPTQISGFSVQEDVSTGKHGGVAAGVHAERVRSGWIAEVTQPFEDTPYNFTGNTGASIAERQAGDIAELGKGIIVDALERDLIGNQRQG